MSLKKFLRVLWREKSVVVGMTVLVTAMTVFWGLFRAPAYKVYLNLEVKRVNQPETKDYQYDQYYALQADNLVTDTVYSWTRSKNFKAAVLTEAGFSETGQKQGGDFLASRKLSSQNLELEITADNRKTVLSLAKILEDMLKNRVANLNQDSAGKPSFAVSIQESEVQVVFINLLFLSLVSFCGGIILGVFLALLFFYLET